MALELNDPRQLLWLLLIPLLLWWSRPPAPKQELRTAHLRQWLAAVARLRRKPNRFSWLRAVLLVLAFLAAVLAHAELGFQGEDGARRLVVLVDGSASLTAREADGRTTWQHLREVLREGLERVPAHVPVSLAIAGRTLDLQRLPVERDLDVLPALPVGAAGFDLGALAEQVAAEDVAVWTLTDGRGGVAVPKVGALTWLGSEHDNLALRAVSVRDDWPLPDIVVVVEVVAWTAAARDVQLVVSGKGVVEVQRQTVRLTGSGKRSRRTLRLRRSSLGGEVRVRIDAKGTVDALPEDDLVLFRVPPPPAPRIAVRGEDPFGLAAARMLARLAGGRIVDPSESADLLLLSGGAMTAALPERARVLSFGTRFREGSGAVGPLRLVDWQRGDRLLRGLDLSELEIGSGLPGGFAPAGGGAAQELLMGEQGLLAVRRAGSLHFAFRLADSNLALLPAFPQLLRRALREAYGQRAEPVLQELRIPPPESDLRRSLTGPSRPLPGFAEDGRSLGVPLLLLAMLLIAVRAHV